MRRPATYCALLAAVTAAGTGCGSWSRVGAGEPKGTSEESITQLFNAEAYYRKLGRLAAGQPLPFVGSVAFAAGPADTTHAIVGL